MRRWVGWQLALAAAVAGAWWVLAPGGRAGSADTYLGAVEAWGVQDSWFVALAAVAGVVVAMVWVARRPDVPDGPSVVRLVAAIVGALVAAVLAVALGVGLDLVTAWLSGASERTDPGGAVETLRLHSSAAVLVWPLAVVLLVLVDALRDLVLTGIRDLVAAARQGRDPSATDRIS